MTGSIMAFQPSAAGLVDDSPTATSGIYQALDKNSKEIRILIVEPGPEDSPIDCRLEHTNLSDKHVREYETISYVWGDASIRGTIFVAGTPTNIPKSSQVALRRMRYPHVPRVLWIDAVCIDQDNQAERGHQVGIMQDVYSHATRNLVWLGPDDGTAQRTLDSIDAVVDEMRTETSDFADLPAMIYRTSGEIYRLSEKVVQAPIAWDALVSFYNNSWFHRLWVVQEVALARHNICHHGKFEFPLDNVLKVALWLQFKYLSGPQDGRFRSSVLAVATIAFFAEHKLGYLATVKQRFRAQACFFMLLLYLRQFKSNEPRDHVYAILGLFKQITSDRPPKSVMPDYTRPVADILTDATRFAIQSMGDLEPLTAVFSQTSGAREAKLPSWVPRWDTNWDQKYDSQHFWVGFKATGDQTMSLDDVSGDGSNVLITRGVTVGPVEHALPGCRPEDWNATDNILAFLSAAERILLDGQKSRTLDGNDDGQKGRSEKTLRRKISCSSASPGNDDISLAVTLVAERQWNLSKFNPSHAPATYIKYKEYLQRGNHFPPRLSELHTWTPDEERQAAYYDRALFHACRNRSFFKLSSGHIGLGPTTMVAGDIVVVLYGLIWPAVLRARPELGANFYQFLGLAYVHGIMYGEAVQKHREEGGEDQLFLLR